MQAFTIHRGKVAVLDRQAVDTDQIIPKQFLKAIGRDGFGQHLFDAWRYQDEGWYGKPPSERTLNPDFPLNQPPAQGASILLTGDSFGVGSSREHAVWALQQYGFCLRAQQQFLPTSLPAMPWAMDCCRFVCLLRQ